MSSSANPLHPPTFEVGDVVVFEEDVKRQTIFPLGRVTRRVYKGGIWRYDVTVINPSNSRLETIDTNTRFIRKARIDDLREISTGLSTALADVTSMILTMAHNAANPEVS